MTKASELRDIYDGIFGCRKCRDVVESLHPREVIPGACDADLTLMAQAPSEKGVRLSGVHWVGTDGQVRRPGGTFLDKYLKTVGYSVDPSNNHNRRPYTTNVLHCWTGRFGKRDRRPSKDELRRCRHWWEKELQIVQPRVLVVLGKPASEAFASVCGIEAKFKELLQDQGEEMTFGNLTVRRFVLPHPTAPYPGKSELYEQVFRNVRRFLED
ncbi:MAG: hypothetical protein DRH17_04505 [Deltaproteobacteria bacterium]|nr:MAG: hypothetical protein DRH17_04505 [Deltaproteobacteria bacterium]